MVLFVSEQGRFQTWLPTAGEIVQYTVSQTFFGKPTECSAVFSRLNSAGVVVQYCDLAWEDLGSRSPQEVLDEARMLLKQHFHFKIDEEQREIVPGSYPVMTLAGEANMRGLGYDGTFKARILLAQDRVYFIHMRVYEMDWCNCRHQMNQVVDSFHVDPGISIPFEPTP